MSDYIKSLLSFMQALSVKGITFAFTNGYASHVGDAREVTLSGSNENEIFNNYPLRGNVTYDKILWIDSDIAFDAEQALKLYESTEDIVTGVYLFADGGTSAYPTLGKPSFTYEQVKDLKELTEIEGCGFGFICVKQGVFEELSRPWFQQVMGSVDIEGKSIDFPIMGEDLSWCKRVRDLGYKIYLDPAVKVTHHKTVKLTWEGIRP
jgi:hypothetical protein